MTTTRTWLGISPAECLKDSDTPQARFITIGIAVIQAAHDGYYPLAAFITTIGTLSYTAPAWIRRWERIKTTYGHHALAASCTSGPAHSITHLRPGTGPGGTRTG